MNVRSVYERCITGGGGNGRLITASDMVTYYGSPFAYWCGLYADKSKQDRNYDPEVGEARRGLATLLHERRAARPASGQTLVEEFGLSGMYLDAPAAAVAQAAAGLQYESEAESDMAVPGEGEGEDIAAVRPDPAMPSRQQFRELLSRVNEGTGLLAQYPLYCAPEGIMGKPDMLRRMDDNTYQVVEIKSHAKILPRDVLQANFYNYLMESVLGTAHDTILIRATSGDSERPYEPDLVTGMLDEMRSLKPDAEPVAIYGGCDYLWSVHNDNTAVSQGNASVLPGVGPRRFRRLLGAGLGGIADVAAADEDRAARMLKGSRIGKRTMVTLRRHARVHESGVHEKNPADCGGGPLPPERKIMFLDIESAASIPYLVGLMEPDGTYVHHLNSDDLIGRLAVLTRGRVLVHWAAHDSTVLTSCGLDADFFDLYRYVRQEYTLPLPKIGIKHVSKWLGFRYAFEHIDYEMCRQLYEDYCESGDKKMLDLALSYNRDDCMALKVVWEWCVKNDDRAGRGL